MSESGPIRGYVKHSELTNQKLPDHALIILNFYFVLNFHQDDSKKGLDKILLYTDSSFIKITFPLLIIGLQIMLNRLKEFNQEDHPANPPMLPCPF